MMRWVLAIIVAVAALLVSIGVLEASTALAQTSSEMAYVISRPKLGERDVATALDGSLLIQAAVPLTDPDLDVFLDCNSCPDTVDIDNDGLGDALWDASGQGRVRGDRGPFRGRALLDTNDATIVFAFRRIERTIRDENGAPFGVVLRGQAQVTDSEGTEKFRFTAAIMSISETPERLTWDIRGSRVSLQFEANGRLILSQH